MKIPDEPSYRYNNPAGELNQTSKCLLNREAGTIGLRFANLTVLLPFSSEHSRHIPEKPASK